MKKIKKAKIIAMGIIAGLTFLVSSVVFAGATPVPLSDRNLIPISNYQQIEKPEVFNNFEEIERTDSYRKNEIIVKFQGDQSRLRIIKVPADKIQAKISEYSKRKDVEYAEPNYIAHTLMTPNDRYYSYQWHLDNSEHSGIEMEDAWNISQGKGAVVAIIDTGVAYRNYRNIYQKAPDLSGTCFVPGYDFVNNDRYPDDDNRHGTYIAGIIAQTTNNRIGTAGVAFKSCLMPVKVMNSEGAGTHSDVAQGIYFAVNHGADVINLSLGGSNSSKTLKDAVKYAYEKGVVVISAAGNNNSNHLTYPAAYDEYVIAAGATQYDKKLAPYSNYGKALDLTAPGGNLKIDQNNDGYGDGILQQTFRKVDNKIKWDYFFMAGTSCSSAQVAGIAALLIANGNATTPKEIESALEETAKDLGQPGFDEKYGWGLVDAYAALQWKAKNKISSLIISDVAVKNVKSVSAEIIWKTNKLSNSAVYYKTEQGTEKIVSNQMLTTNHSIKLTGLDKGTAYYFKVQSKDIFRKEEAVDDNNGAYYVFTTLPNCSPVAKITFFKKSVFVNERLIFNGLSSYDVDGRIVNYHWDFGDETSADGKITAHNYETSGNYTVTLAVTDDDGAESKDTVKVLVKEKQKRALFNPSPKKLIPRSPWRSKYLRNIQNIRQYNSNLPWNSYYSDYFN